MNELALVYHLFVLPVGPTPSITWKDVFFTEQGLSEVKKFTSVMMLHSGVLITTLNWKLPLLTKEKDSLKSCYLSDGWCFRYLFCTAHLDFYLSKYLSNSTTSPSTPSEVDLASNTGMTGQLTSAFSGTRRRVPTCAASMLSRQRHLAVARLSQILLISNR